MLDAVSTSEEERSRILGPNYEALKKWVEASRASFPPTAQKRPSGSSNLPLPTAKRGRLAARFWVPEPSTSDEEDA